MLEMIVSDAVRKRGRKTFGRGKLGSGSRFKACVKSGKSPALCAYIGRRAYGKKRFAKLSAGGRKKAARSRKR